MEENKEKNTGNNKRVIKIIIVIACILISLLILPWEIIIPTVMKKIQPKTELEIKPSNNSINAIEDTNQIRIRNEITTNVVETNTIVINEINQDSIKENEELNKSIDKNIEDNKEVVKQEEKKEVSAQNKETITQAKEPKENKTEENKTEKDNIETKPVEPKEPAKPTKTGTDTSRELTKTETKYGVKTNTYTITTYDVYSDGSKKIVNTREETEYDNSGFNATTSEMLPEAKELKSKNSSKINEVLKYTNQLRNEANKNKIDGVSDRKDLKLDSNLTVAACVRAMELAYADKFSHTRPNGQVCFSIFKDMNISALTYGENIAWGQSSGKTVVMNTWKNSQGHYKNMISPEYGKIGVGVIQYRGVNYWVQIFSN